MNAAPRLLAPLLCLLAIPAFAEPLTRRNYAAYFQTPKGAHIATRYANGKPKVDGTFILRRNRVMPHGVVQIWYPSGKLYQRYDPARNILTTWYPGGTIQREERAPLELGGSYTQTRFYVSGQMRERIVERFNDTQLKQRLEFYYAFEPQTEGTPANRLSSLRRSEHIQFQLKEGWHPNGQPHFVARYNSTAPVAQRTTWTWYDAKGVEDPSTRYFYRVNRSSKGPSGWIKEGLHLEYHDNGQLSSRIEYQNNRKHGRVQHFTDTGQIILDGVYKRGELRGGTRTMWNAKGQIKGWEDGGAAMTFDDAGGLKSHVHRFGSGEFMVVYDGTGAITLENIRLPNSQTRHLFSPKNPHSTPTASRYMGELRNNRPFGRWTVLQADDAKVIDIGFDARGRLSGSAKQWFPEGQVAVDCTFEAGQPHGLLRTWYADGTKALEAMMVKGQTIGPYATWYANGRPKEKEVRSTTGQRILGKWNAAGQAEVLEVHDPEKHRDVTSRMHAGVVTSRQYRYPGRKTIDSDQYHAMGKLKVRTEYVDDDPKHFVVREYWPSGPLKSRATYRGGHAVGVFETWHETGQVARRMRLDSKGIQGVVNQWSADGSPLPDTHFIDGIEQITPETDPCFCNKAAKRPRRFQQPASRLFDLEALRAAQPGLQLQGYDNTFLRWSGNYEALSGTLLSAVPLVAEIAGARLVLNPCRHGTNLSAIEMSMRSDSRGADVELQVGTLGLEFPAVLKPLEGDAPYRMTAEVGTLSRAVDGALERPRTRKVCVPPARVGKTGLVLRPAGGRVTFGAEAGDQDGAQNVPAFVASAGRFEFTDAEGGVFYGRIEHLRVTGQGLTLRIGGALDGPKGGVEALARGLTKQGYERHYTEARSSVVCSGDGILCVVYSASQGRPARRSELGVPGGLQ